MSDVAKALRFGIKDFLGAKPIEDHGHLSSAIANTLTDSFGQPSDQRDFCQWFCGWWRRDPGRPRVTLAPELLAGQTQAQQEICCTRCYQTKTHKTRPAALQLPFVANQRKWCRLYLIMYGRWMGSLLSTLSIQRLRKWWLCDYLVSESLFHDYLKEIERF